MVPVAVAVDEREEVAVDEREVVDSEWSSH
jgi:hypothetical protein